MFTYITRADHMMIVLNTLLLMDVAFIPFTTAVVGQYIDIPHEQQVAMLLYSGTLVVGGILYNLFWRYVVRAGLLAEGADRGVIRTLSQRYLLGPILYTVAFAVAFLNGAASFVVCILLAVLYIVPGFTHNA